MSRLTTLPMPWFSLAERLGGAGNLYAELMTRLEIAVRALFAKQKVKF